MLACLLATPTISFTSFPYLHITSSTNVVILITQEEPVKTKRERKRARKGGRGE